MNSVEAKIFYSKRGTKFGSVVRGVMELGFPTRDPVGLVNIVSFNLKINAEIIFTHSKFMQIILPIF
jgi:hypothetical protein